MTRSSKKGNPKSNKGFGSTSNNCNTRTTRQLHLVVKSDLDPRYGGFFDYEACSRYYNADPSLIFTDIDQYQYVQSQDPSFRPFGIDLSDDEGYRSFLDVLLIHIDLTQATLEAIDRISMFRGLGEVI